jgi:NADP-dependent 3-hydroxy acid dehydrogenase YdfG
MSTSTELTGTVALVAGASSGIGEATALALAETGATVAIAARRKDRLDELAQRITERGGRALAIEADVGDRAQAEALMQRTVDELGRLNTLVNNAGVMLLGPAVDAPVGRPALRSPTWSTSAPWPGARPATARPSTT